MSVKRGTNGHMYLGRFGDYDAFQFAGAPCITNPEMRSEDASDIAVFLSYVGMTAYVGKYKHYANVFGIPERIDEQTCVYFQNVSLQNAENAIRKAVKVLESR